MKKVLSIIAATLALYSCEKAEIVKNEKKATSTTEQKATNANQNSSIASNSGSQNAKTKMRTLAWVTVGSASAAYCKNEDGNCLLTVVISPASSARVLFTNLINAIATNNNVIAFFQTNNSELSNFISLEQINEVIAGNYYVTHTHSVYDNLDYIMFNNQQNDIVAAMPIDLNN